MVEGLFSGSQDSGCQSGFQLIVQSNFLRAEGFGFPFFSNSDCYGVVAQLAEHLLCKQGVASSNLAGSIFLARHSMAAAKKCHVVVRVQRTKTGALDNKFVSRNG
jgi:hypothetical protein